ncbi:MAG: hypothetical protein ACHQM4_05540 [Thermoanaerobaculia bacterium]
MKKLTSALALVAVAASLVACSQPEQKKPEVKVEAPKVVEETAKTASTASTASTSAPAATASTSAPAATASTAAPAATAPAKK